jgi:crotonobetainyl-CoA:carnitine CoA-transferase CaiB-like acyl-CoA transferase
MTKAGPLAGMKVIELAHIMAGPVCGLMLADMGADVIKVEKPDGDDSRRFVPPAMMGESAAYMMMNRNKRGVALNLKDPGAVEALTRLLKEADVVIENYRMGTMERLGLGYEDLRAINPRLIYCEISGFGRTGPYAMRGGFDLIAQGMSGLMSITGEGPGRPPVKTGAPVSDITAGIVAAMGVSAAYAHILASGDRLCHRCRARPDGVGASPERPLSGVRDGRWLDQCGRRQSAQLAAVSRRDRRTGVERRSALCLQPRPDAASGGA